MNQVESAENSRQVLSKHRIKLSFCFSFTYHQNFENIFTSTLFIKKSVIVTVFTVTSVPIICPSLHGALSLSSALLVCPSDKAYISVTMGWILIKLGGESVGT